MDYVRIGETTQILYEKSKSMKHSILSQASIKFAGRRIFSDTIRRSYQISDCYQKICKQKLLDEMRSPDFPNKNEIKKIGTTVNKNR